jgi:RNA polymerase sigma-70 factor, ECF subfamily
VPALDPQSLPRHLDRLYRAAWALCGSPHDAEDLVQETCARVLARPRRLHGEDELAYLMTVLRNTFLTHLRTTSRRPRTGQVPVEELDPVDLRSGTRPETAVEAREVFATIAGLPERYRLALVAVDVVGLSYREAGTILETREATIATRVFRARQLLARRLAPDAAEPQEATSDAAEPPVAAEESAPAVGSAPAAGRTPAAGSIPAAEDTPAAGSTPATRRTPAAEDTPEHEEAPTPDGPAPREGEPSSRRLTQRGH